MMKTLERILGNLERFRCARCGLVSCVPHRVGRVFACGDPFFYRRALPAAGGGAAGAGGSLAAALGK